jgi:SAM-dependent methyltransferase
VTDAAVRSTTPAPLSFNAWLRWELIRRLLPNGGRFLEVGCGQGGLAVLLTQQFDYTGYEPDPESFRVARQRIGGRGKVVNEFLPEEPDQVFDVVGAFEVLEHIEDDRAALEEWRRWLAPHGHLLLSVPSHQDRFGPADVAVGHYRRYERDDLRRLLTSVGFDGVTVLSYGFPAGFALEWARNRALTPDADLPLEERTARSGRVLQPVARPWVTQLATAPFRWMQLPMRRTDIGTGYVASGRSSA